MEYNEFGKELVNLRLRLSDLGMQVKKAVAESLTALETNDLATCSAVIEADRQINHTRVAIEEHTFRLLAFQQTFGGDDLYFLTSTFAIAGELERLGDGAKGIALLLLRMTPFEKETGAHKQTFTSTDQEDEIRKDLLTLGNEMQVILDGTLTALSNQDSTAARQISTRDDIVDQRYQNFRHQLMTMLTAAHAIPALLQDSRYLQRLTYLLWIAHKLERMADHCTNICKRIISSTKSEARQSWHPHRSHQGSPPPPKKHRR